MANEILTNTEAHVGVIRLNRPKQLNALNIALMKQLVVALEAFDDDEGLISVPIDGMTAFLTEYDFGAG